MSQGFYGFPNILGVLRATAFKAVGKIGATAGAALAGATTSGAPTSGGPFDVGDVIVSQSDGSLWVCTVAGTSQSSPGTFVQAGFANPMSTKGDLIVGGTAGAASRLGVGSDNQVLTADSVQSLGVKWAAAGAASLTTATGYLASTVTMTSANTLYDGASVSLAAGTWLIVAGQQFQSAGTVHLVKAKLWDGTTDAAQGGVHFPGVGYEETLTLAALVTPGATTTYKLSAATGSGSGDTMVATDSSILGTNWAHGGYIVAVKVA